MQDTSTAYCLAVEPAADVLDRVLIKASVKAALDGNRMIWTWKLNLFFFHVPGGTRENDRAAIIQSARPSSLGDVRFFLTRARSLRSTSL
jgi:hypothetical protein